MRVGLPESGQFLTFVNGREYTLKRQLVVDEYYF
jgi:hypothetical protein